MALLRQTECVCARTDRVVSLYFFKVQLFFVSGLGLGSGVWRGLGLGTRDSGCVREGERKRGGKGWERKSAHARERVCVYICI